MNRALPLGTPTSVHQTTAETSYHRRCVIRPRLIGAAAVTYLAVFALAFSRVSEGFAQWIHPGLAAAIAMMLGPPVLFLTGVQAWPVFVAFICLIAILAGLAYIAWRRSPDTEWFAFWGLLALLVWVSAPWFAVLAHL